MSLVLIIFRILISPGCLFKKAETEYVFLTFRRILALWQLCVVTFGESAHTETC